MTVRNVLGLGCVIACLASPPSWAQPVAVNIHSFVNPLGGIFPSPVVGHEIGGGANTWALYGTTQRAGMPSSCYGQGCGVVFALSPPPPGQTEWIETRVYVFKSLLDGWMPEGPVTFDGAGAAYGSTFFGGTLQGGTIFRLTPPVAGEYFWNKAVLYSFDETSNCNEPRGPLLLDGAGALYGVGNADGGGGACFFKLTPPVAGQTKWSFSTLYTLAFNSPGSPTLALGRAGELYGTTPDAAVFSLSPPAAPAGTWTYTVLYNFLAAGYTSAVPTELNSVELQSDGSLIGASGNGGTASIGTVFRLAPPAGGQGAWTPSVLYSFQGPEGASPQSLGHIDASSSLYGVTATRYSGTQPPIYGGVVFRLDPPKGGAGAWSETVLGATKDAQENDLSGVPVRDPLGKFYATASFGHPSPNSTIDDGAVVVAPP